MPNLFHKHEPSPEKDNYIEWINSQNLSWKANSCLLSKSHPSFDKEKCAHLL